MTKKEEMLLQTAVVSEKYADAERRSRTVVMVFYSPQGGTGRTTVAFNVAVNYALKKLKVLFVDMSLYGGVNNYLGQKQPGRGLDYLLSILRQDIDILKEGLGGSYIRDAVHGFIPDYMDVLTSNNPVGVDGITFEEAKNLMDSMVDSGNYDVIVVDTSTELSERNIACFLKAQHLIIVVRPDISAVDRIVSFRDSVVSKLGISSGKVQVVANRYSRELSAIVAEFANITGYEIVQIIPEIYPEVTSGINAGIPAAMGGYTVFNIYVRRLAARYLNVFGDSDLKLKRSLFTRKEVKCCR